MTVILPETNSLPLKFNGQKIENFPWGIAFFLNDGEVLVSGSVTTSYHFCCVMFHDVANLNKKNPRMSSSKPEFEAFEETIEAHHKAPKGTMASHVEIAKAIINRLLPRDFRGFLCTNLAQDCCHF